MPPPTPSSVSGPSPTQPLLPNPPSTNRTPRNKHNANPQRRPGSLAITLTNNFLQMRFQSAIVLETRAHALRNLLRVLVALERGSEAGPQDLVEGCGAHGDAEDGAEGAEEVAACCCDGLVGVGCVCDWGVC